MTHVSMLESSLQHVLWTLFSLKSALEHSFLALRKGTLLMNLHTLQVHLDMYMAMAMGGRVDSRD